MQNYYVKKLETILEHASKLQEEIKTRVSFLSTYFQVLCNNMRHYVLC
jgi:hypothetical protein